MTRKPQQQRAKATVDAIVQAGFLCLAKHGIEGTTTRHIADEAGIGVGSLYEYFANKQEVMDAMYQMVVADVVSMIQPLTPRLVKMEIHEAVRTLLYEFRELLMRDDARYLKYASQAVNVAQRDNLEPINKILNDLVVQYVMHHPEVMRLRNLPVMSYIIINGGIFSVIRHLGESAPMLTFDQLAGGLADMAKHVMDGEMRKVDNEQ
ncbi:MAG: TetR/AcrR family transcriptional regulator [Gammaproteobacteria bacterium]|jgi:AcrR family transcriptional regulator|nr:TetR/AcrR family transcriptional regulator [Gammaproteobacteria bacterium]MBQ0774874.1 TetR/AcrR family transcriptional regulator [Gammaproteobacteria bacterium]|tara:strand:- start:114771 stop:115391 length:621 start_codon:yes stop_codon:yes gene_type:complete